MLLTVSKTLQLYTGAREFAKFGLAALRQKGDVRPLASWGARVGLLVTSLLCDQG
jgi:hypothetical protein